MIGYITNKQGDQLIRVDFDKDGTINFVSLWCDLTTDYHLIDADHLEKDAVLYKKVSDFVDSKTHGGEDEPDVWEDIRIDEIIEGEGA